MLSRFARRADAALFLAVALVSTALTLVAVAGSLGRVGRPFAGFVVWDDLVVVALGRPGWTGILAAVPFRTQVVAVDGRPVADRAALEALVEAAPVGTEHRYAFADAGGRREVRDVASMPFRIADWASTMGVYVVNGLGFVAIGLAVFWLKPESRQSRALLAFGSIWGSTLVLAVDLFTAGRLQALYFLLEALSPAAILHLTLVFPAPRRPLRRSSWPILPVYALAAGVGVAQAWLFRRSYTALLAVNTAVYAAIAAATIFGLGAVAYASVRGATPLARRRARVVLAGAVAAFLIPVLALLAFLLIAQPVSFSWLTITGFLFPLAVGYAIARHDLFEADRFVKLSLVYAVLTATVALVYGTTVLVANWAAADLAVARSPLFPIGFVLAALVTIVPLRDRVQRGVDRVFYRGRVDYKATVARASERMTTLLDRDAIVADVMSTVQAVLFCDATVWERDGDALVRRGPRPARLAATAGLDVLAGRRGVLSRDEVAESPALRDARATLSALFADLGAELVVPLLRHETLAGLIAVGPKASGSPLSADDVDVLRTLANEAAIALANAAAVEQLRDAQAKLIVSERLAAMGELAAAVAHGIRNPLAGIRLTAQLGLEVTPADHPVRENLADVVSEVDKLERQVRGVLDFARPFEPRLEPTDIAELLGSLVHTIAPRLEAAHIAVQVRIAPDVPPLRADRAHLTQALNELVGNAVEAMPEGGKLAIDAARSDDGRRMVRIAIADTGPGVPPEMRERVFQLFITTRCAGTGVGLAVVKKIVERHGGSVRLEGVEPHGARFVLELPAAA